MPGGWIRAPGVMRRRHRWFRTISVRDVAYGCGGSCFVWAARLMTGRPDVSAAVMPVPQVLSTRVVVPFSAVTCLAV